MEYLVKNKAHKDYSGITKFSEVNLDNFFDFDYYRIVNPVTKEVFAYENNKLTKFENYHCYDIWETGKSCDYCVSANALVTKSVKRKLEQIDGTLYHVKVFPISIDDQVFVIELFQNIGDSYLKTNNENIKLSTLISQLNKIASIDNFSGLFSHGFMVNKLTEITRENILPVSLICMDVDKMKYVNDTFGHFYGDELIKSISKELVKLTTDNILPGRTGGDEFQILFNGYTQEEAIKLSQEALKSIERTYIKDDYFSTISWAIGKRDDNQSAKDFMNEVDSKMYKVKSENHLL
jgi:diguanylate cyclase (GGDEF)-like protein